MAARDGWLSAAVLDAQGQTLVHSARSPGTPLPSVADRDYIQAALRSGRPSISNLIPDARVVGQPALVIAVPVVRKGVLHYVLRNLARAA